jgi:hypothetical protein
LRRWHRLGCGTKIATTVKAVLTLYPEAKEPS